MATADALITKLRPTTWKEVIGHHDVVRSVRDALINDTSHAFMFCGPAGLGKTTMGRLIANDVCGGKAEVTEIPAAVYTGVDDMRPLLQGLRFYPLSGEGKVMVLDECHRLSKNAWDSLLKDIEEPADWVWWVLCTTDPDRVPKTIRQRCLVYNLKPVTPNELTDFLDEVARDEGFDVPDAVVDLCVKEAGGSPRQALANLAACAQCQDRREAAELLRSPEAGSEAIDLARALVEGKGWDKIQPILDKLKDTEAEGIRHVVRAYVTTAILGAERQEKAVKLFHILEAFTKPSNFNDGISPVVLAVGEVLFAG